MTSAAVAAVAADLRFVLEYQAVDGVWRSDVLPLCCGERFEDALPVRPFHFEKGLRSFAGWWYFATTGTHVGFESWLERDHLMLMDFDPDVRAVASQPFWLRWRDESGARRRHAPDYFARRCDGTGMVVDVRPDDRIPDRDAEAFAVTAAACELAGWRFRRVGEIDRVLTANVRWLSRYRHPRCWVPEIAAALLDVFVSGTGLFAGATLVGERLRVLPVLFHLLWHRQLVADLSGGPLGASMLVRTGDAR
ncbi:MAG TPA: TnsA-like heteromeric transposase endonuclease subunit [Nakamurella sp.]